MGFKQDLQRFPHENCKFWGMPRFGVANPGVSDWFQPRCFSDIVTAINAETDSEDWKRGKFSGIPIEKKDILNAFMIIIYGYGYYGSTLWSPWIVKFRPITEVTSMVPPLAADTASVTHHVYPRRKKQRKARCSSCARLRVCMYIHIWSYMHIYIYLFLYVRMYIYISMYLCIYVYIHIIPDAFTYMSTSYFVQVERALMQSGKPAPRLKRRAPSIFSRGGSPAKIEVLPATTLVSP